GRIGGMPGGDGFISQRGFVSETLPISSLPLAPLGRVTVRIVSASFSFKPHSSNDLLSTNFSAQRSGKPRRKASRRAGSRRSCEQTCSQSLSFWRYASCSRQSFSFLATVKRVFADCTSTA